MNHIMWFDKRYNIKSFEIRNIYFKNTHNQGRPVTDETFNYKMSYILVLHLLFFILVYYVEQF